MRPARAACASDLLTGRRLCLGTHLPSDVRATGNGWPGFYGTAWYNDPAEDRTTIVFMQRAHMGDQTLPMWHDFWTAVYQAIDD